MIWIEIDSKIMKLLYIHFQRVKKTKAVKQSAIMITKIISMKKDTKMDNTATVNIV